MSDFDTDDETRRQLRALDPARSLPPVDADALASLMEGTMSQPHPDSTSATPRRPRGMSRGVLAVGVAAAGILAVITLVNGGDDKPTNQDHSGPSTAATVTRLTGPSGASGKCMAPSADAVAQQPVAVEGTVTSIKNGLVTLKPSRFYAGKKTDLVTVTEPDLRMSEMPVAFEVGQDYIVGATDGQVSICGLSGLATDDLKSLYDEAFGK